jgi:HlyD family secretion protein
MNNASTRLRRFVWWTLGIALMAATAYVAMRPQKLLVDTAEVLRQPMQVTVDEDGITRIRERYIVSTPLSGRLLRITLDVGDPVKANETTLARMEPNDPALLDPRMVAQAEARVRAAQRKLEAAKSELTKAKNALNFAESEMGRVRSLREKNAASDLEFAEKELAFRQATEDARSAELAVDIAKYELELQEAALILTDPKKSEDSNAELPIKSPIDGRVLRINQESAAVITAGSPLMELGDPSDLEIVSDVLSRDVVRIQRGNDVSLEHWGGEVPLRGRVRLVEPSGFTKLSALGVEEQRVNVVIDLLDPLESRTQLGDNFRVDCQIIVWQADDVLQVPTSALFRIDERWHLFAVKNGRAMLAPVEVGHNNGRQAEVLGGIESGSVVVIHPSDTLEDGVEVEQR